MPLSLLLGVHAHQPVGNFPFVIDDAHQRCYKPFLETLFKFPEFQFAAHFSGWLLEYLIRHYPQDMELLAKMASRGQVEFFGAGDCEPVLAAIPFRDRVSQLDAMADRLERHYGQRPRGAWLTERVWESSVVPALADTGIRYVAVDDYHFLCAGKSANELGGFYSTEEDGRRLDAFPISEALRYRVPFSKAQDAVTFLESLADQGQVAAIYFDDIEKFGIWPETYEWVYTQRWLEQFIIGVLESKKIVTTTYADFHAATPTRGVVYLPTTSYIEMNEWTLPPHAAREYSRLVDQEKQANRYDQSKAHIRGGIWRNFFMRYSESNWMHKRMLGLSHRLAGLPANLRSAELQELLHQAQANDAYWHGLFGGLYLPHLRRAIWNNLVALEGALDRIAPRQALERSDIDLDGHEEIVLHDAQHGITLRLDGSATVQELVAYALRHNFGDTLTRRREHYYRRFDESPHQHHGDGIASAHDRVSFKHEIHHSDLLADAEPRAMFVDCVRTSTGHWHHVADYALLSANATQRALEFEARVGETGRIAKRIALEDNRIVVRYRFKDMLAGEIAVRINLAMPSCDGIAGRYVLPDGSVPGGFGQNVDIAKLGGIELRDDVLGGMLAIRVAPPVALHAAPCYTVSLSEAGFEKIMQSTTLTLTWPLGDTPNEVLISLEARPG